MEARIDREEGTVAAHRNESFFWFEDSFYEDSDKKCSYAAEKKHAIRSGMHGGLRLLRERRQDVVEVSVILHRIDGNGMPLGRIGLGRRRRAIG